MRALEQASAPPRPRLLEATPLAALAALAAAWGLAALILPSPAARGIGLAAAHGGLLGTALAWTAADGARERWAPLQAALVLGAATLLAHLVPGGVMAYLAVPAWVVWRRVEWRRDGAEHARAVLAGALFGLLLGLHLLVNASLPLGFHLRPGRPADLLAWFAYDLGANVLTAEAFFRAGLFARAHRRWPFAVAAALSTAASPGRSPPACCSSPPTVCWRADVAVAIALALGGITALIAVSDAGVGSLWRHAYHVPVVVAALRWVGGGVLAALAAMLLYTPFVLPALERVGPSSSVLEALLTLGLLLGVGVSSG